MSTTITYADMDDIAVSAHQIESMSEFKKVYWIDGLIKKVEIYIDNVFAEIQYIKDPGESIEAIFFQLETDSVTIISYKVRDDYVSEILDCYVSGRIGSTTKRLLINKKIVCLHELDSNGNINLSLSGKYLYDQDGSKIGEEIFSFHYNSDGTLRYISGIGYPFSNENQTLDAPEISLYFPNLLNENPYYRDLSYLPR